MYFENFMYKKCKINKIFYCLLFIFGEVEKKLDDIRFKMLKWILIIYNEEIRFII